MKILHLIFSTSSVFLILKFSPFNKLIKVLLIFSYFLFFEYSIISRNYAIEILLIIIFCILYKNKYKNILSISVVLFLLSSCNIYAFFFSVIFIIVLIYDYIKQRKNEAKKAGKIKTLFSALIALSGIAMVYFQIGNQLLSNAFILDPFSESLFQNYLIKLKTLPNVIINAFIQIPEIKTDFWNTNLFLNSVLNNNLILKSAVALIILLLSAYLLSNKFKFVYIVSTFLFFNFMILFYFGLMRHWGQIFILFFACVWLSIKDNEDNNFYNVKNRKIILNCFLIIILVSSVTASAIASYFDYTRPFSNSKKTAEYIKDKFNPEELIIAGHKDYAVEPVSGYLDKEFYYPEEKIFTRNVGWTLRKETTAIEIYEDIINIKLKNPDKRIMFIKSNFNLIPGWEEIKDEFTFLNDFTGSIVFDEDYELFLLKNDINSELIKKIDYTNYKDILKNINNCDLVLKDNKKLLLESHNNDPNFEFDFSSVSLNKTDELFIRIIIELEDKSDLTIYYKRNDSSSYDEKDSTIRGLRKGPNDILVKVEDFLNLESMRLDPLNTLDNGIIEKIEIYKIIKE